MIFKLKKEEILEVMFYFEKGNVIGISSVAYTLANGYDIEQVMRKLVCKNGKKQ